MIICLPCIQTEVLIHTAKELCRNQELSISINITHDTIHRDTSKPIKKVPTIWNTRSMTHHYSASTKQYVCRACSVAGNMLTGLISFDGYYAGQFNWVKVGVSYCNERHIHCIALFRHVSIISLWCVCVMLTKACLMLYTSIELC